jgi:putative redox protein
MNPPRSLQFPGASGDMLAARLDLPPGKPRAYALFAHCFTCSKDSLAATRISQALTGEGFAVLRFDFTGLGGSGGDFANTNFSSNVADLVAAADFLRTTYTAPALLIGHSLGGAAVLAAAHRIPESVAVATIGAPSEPAHVRQLLAPAEAELTARGEAEIDLAGRRFHIRQQLLDDLAQSGTTEAIGRLRKALLIFHSPLDKTVSIDNAAQIFLAAKHPKSFVSLDQADHLVTRKEDALYIAQVLAAWAGRYVGVATPHDVTAAPGEVVVAETGEGKFQQAVAAGPHRLLADEPVAAGGDDTGPSPYDLLLAALGTCTAMTLRLYADQKKLPLERVSVRLRHAKVHAQDCADCETREGKIDRIDRDITLAGPLDAVQRAKLLEIADKCPVHRTLHSEVWVTTRLAADPAR